MTRSIETIIRRVQADLPITKAEADVLSAHLDTVIARNARIAKVAIAISGILLVLTVIVAVLRFWGSP